LIGVNPLAAVICENSPALVAGVYGANRRPVLPRGDGGTMLPTATHYSGLGPRGCMGNGWHMVLANSAP